jgi:hypothetical protein
MALVVDPIREECADLERLEDVIYDLNSKYCELSSTKAGISSSGSYTFSGVVSIRPA